MIYQLVLNTNPDYTRAMKENYHISHLSKLPKWRRPEALLILMAIAMPLAFSVWSALLNNFVVEIIRFDGLDIGILHTVREIPGFFAVGSWKQEKTPTPEGGGGGERGGKGQPNPGKGEARQKKN